MQAGETADVPAQPTTGETRVREAYLELRAPILGDLPAIKRLELSAAVRYSDYDNIGSDNVFKGGIYWRVVDDLAVRANYAEGFRAPNIGELFNSGSRFDSNINDPCSNYLTNGSATVQANCAALGVPTSFTQINQQISVQTGGNEELKPETSETMDHRLHLQPVVGRERFLDRRSVVRRQLLRHQARGCDPGAVGAEPADQLREHAVAAVLRRHRARAGRFDHGVRQSAHQHRPHRNRRLRLDSDAVARRSRAGAGCASSGPTPISPATRSSRSARAGLVATERAGIEVGSPTRGYVRYKSTLAVDWLFHDFVTSLTLRYLSELTETCPSSVVDNGLANQLCSDPVNLTERDGQPGLHRPAAELDARRSSISNCRWRSA